MMGRHFLVRAIGGCAVLTLALFLGSLRPVRLPAAETPKSAPEGANDVFGQSKVWTIDLEIPAKEFEAMQPAAPAFGGLGGPPRPKAKTRTRESERNLFGTEFPWVEGELTANGKTLKKVGLRYAGDATYFVSTRGLKRPLKVRFGKSADQQLYGLVSLQLHAMLLDPSKAREALAYSVFRAAGVPAPRTAWPRSRSPFLASTRRPTWACTPWSKAWTGSSSPTASAPTRAC